MRKGGIQSTPPPPMRVGGTLGGGEGSERDPNIGFKKGATALKKAREESDCLRAICAGGLSTHLRLRALRDFYGKSDPIPGTSTIPSTLHQPKPRLAPTQYSAWGLRARASAARPRAPRSVSPSPIGPTAPRVGAGLWDTGEIQPNFNKHNLNNMKSGNDQYVIQWHQEMKRYCLRKRAQTLNITVR